MYSIFILYISVSRHLDFSFKCSVNCVLVTKINAESVGMNAVDGMITL